MAVADSAQKVAAVAVPGGLLCSFSPQTHSRAAAPLSQVECRLAQQPRKQQQQQRERRRQQQLGLLGWAVVQQLVQQRV